MFLALELLCFLHLVFLKITLSRDCAWQSFIGPKPELERFSKPLRFIIYVFTYHSVLFWALGWTVSKSLKSPEGTFSHFLPWGMLVFPKLPDRETPASLEVRHCQISKAVHKPVRTLTACFYEIVSCSYMLFHRMDKVGRVHWRWPNPTCLLKQVSLQHITQDCLQAPLEYLQR